MKHPYILMLESDPHDRELTMEFFAKDKRNIHVDFLSYSYEVLPYLHSAPSLPALILLRLNAVPDTGLLVLESLKRNEAFQHVPVIILSEGTTSKLITQCYASGANTVIDKPFTYEETNIKIQYFLQYWFDVAALPKVGQVLNLN